MGVDVMFYFVPIPGLYEIQIARQEMGEQVKKWGSYFVDMSYTMDRIGKCDIQGGSTPTVRNVNGLLVFFLKLQHIHIILE